MESVPGRAMQSNVRGLTDSRAASATSFVRCASVTVVDFPTDATVTSTRPRRSVSIKVTVSMSVRARERRQ